MERLADWYPALVNPNVHGEVQHCANEVVFPLMTFPLLFLAYRAALVVVFRLPLWATLRQRTLVSDAQNALVLFPLAAILHVVGGGLLYYAYPYVVLISIAIQGIFDWRHTPSQPFTVCNGDPGT